MLLKYEVINARLPDALKRLSRLAMVNPKVAYQIMKISQGVEKEVKNARDLFLSVAKKHAVLDEKGELKPKLNEEGVPVQAFEVPEDKQAAFDAEVAELLKIEFEINQPAIKLSDLGNTQLTASDISDLEPVLNPLESV